MARRAGRTPGEVPPPYGSQAGASKTRARCVEGRRPPCRTPSTWVADLYRGLPEARIADLPAEVDDATRFTEVPTHLQTGRPCRDGIGLLNVALVEDIDLGLSKITEAGRRTGSGTRCASRPGS